MNSDRRPSIDVVVRWGGDCVLSAVELSPPRSFFVGEDEGCDVALPAEIAGGSRVPVLLARWDGKMRAVVPKGARVVLDGKGKAMTAARAMARGHAEPSRGYRDAAEVTLFSGRRVDVRLGAVTIEITVSEGAKRVPRAPVIERRTGFSQAASFAMHAALLGAAAFVTPPFVEEGGGVTVDQMFYINRMLNRIAEREMEGFYEDAIGGLEWRGQRRWRKAEARAAREQDEAWMRVLYAASERWSSELAAEARAEEPQRGDPGDTSVIGLFYEKLPKPKLPPPRPTLTPAEKKLRMGGTLPAEPSRRGKAPGVRRLALQVSGRLPPEVIVRIVRQNFGRFRLCYENGLRLNPNLQGRVAVRFVIGRDGAVSNVGNGGSDLPDGGVVRCVMRSFEGLSFPQPEAGIVTVVFPIQFEPGG